MLNHKPNKNKTFTVLQARSDSDVMLCLQSYQGLDKSLCINPIGRIGLKHTLPIDSR